MELTSSSISSLSFSWENDQPNPMILRQPPTSSFTLQSSLHVTPKDCREVHQASRSISSYPEEKALNMVMMKNQSLGIADHLSHPLRENGSSGGRTHLSLLSNTLFVGDLPVLCDEEKLFNLFYRFGEIEVIQLKKNSSDPQRSHFSYGFVKFALHESAVRALEEMNGFPFYGRNLRLGWADDRGSNHHQKHPAVEVLPSRKILSTAQIHVSFIAKNKIQPISEMDLRAVFQEFGNIVDVTIKKNIFNQAAGVQSGYGFVHFALTEEGIQSAFTAVDKVNQQVVEGISFECTVTHGLKTYLLSLRPASRSTLSQSPISEPRGLPYYPHHQMLHSSPFHVPLQQHSHQPKQQRNYEEITIASTRSEPPRTQPYLFGSNLSELNGSYPEFGGGYSQSLPNSLGNDAINRSLANEGQFRLSSYHFRSESF